MIRRLTDTKFSANKKAAEELGLEMDAVKSFMVKRKTTGVR